MHITDFWNILDYNEKWIAYFSSIFWYACKHCQALSYKFEKKLFINPSFFFTVTFKKIIALLNFRHPFHWCFVALSDTSTQSNSVQNGIAILFRIHIILLPTHLCLHICLPALFNPKSVPVTPIKYHITFIPQFLI